MQTRKKPFQSKQIAEEFARCDSGGIAVLMAAGLAVLIGAAAIAIDLSYAYVERNRLQIAADTAALAAANELPDESAARAAAQDFAARNMPDEGHGDVLMESDVAIGVWDSSNRTFTADATPPNAVRVSTRRTEANGNALGLFFGRALGIGSLDLSASAIAGGTRQPTCLIALDPSSSQSLLLRDSAGVAANGCDVQVNSDDDEALTTRHLSTIDANRICVHGDYAELDSSQNTPAPISGCPELVDPLSWLEPPDSSGCDYDEAEYSGFTGTLDPGVYCEGLRITDGSNVTLNPGIYVIKDEVLKIDSLAEVTGEDVGFYLTDGATIDFAGGARISLKAPTSGDMAGILFFQDRSDSGSHDFDTENTVQLEGTVYLPNGVLRSSAFGHIGGGSAFTIYIAHRFELDGVAGLDINSDYENSDVPLPARLDTVGSALLE